MAAPKVLIATRTFVVEVNGERHVVRKGERLDSNHPAVKARPGHFEDEASAGVRQA